MWPGYDNKKLDVVLTNIKDAYYSSKTREDRKHVIALIAPGVPLSVLQEYIPGITHDYFTSARKLFAETRGTRLTPAENRRIKYDEKKVKAFINYITSAHVVTDLPFGQSKATYTSGEKTDIPNVVRNQRKSRIADEYLQYLKQSGETTDLALSKSSLLRILNFIPAQRRKSVQGIDYFTFAGVEGIDKLIELIRTAGLFNQAFVDLTSLNLAHLKHYLKGDYKISLSSDSQAADHCPVYALSDASQPKFRKTCSHDHKLTCDRCESGKRVLADIQTAVTERTFTSPQEKNRAVYTVSESIRDINEWKKHQLRAVYLDKNKFATVEAMDQLTIFTTMDWAMKLLPLKRREDQTSWFGKRGMNWHVTVVHVKVTSPLELSGAWLRSRSGYYSRNFVHLPDNYDKQDAAAVISILTHVLKEVKQELPWITKAILRSDNAGCYHGAHTILSVHAVSKATKIKVIRWLFSEPQGGKGPSDRMAGVIKRHIRQYVDEGKSVINSREFLMAAKSYRGIKHTSFYRGDITHTTKFDTANSGLLSPIHGIRNYFEFQFEFNPDDIKVYKYPGIGEGVGSYTADCPPARRWLQDDNIALFSVTDAVHEQYSTKPGNSKALWGFWKTDNDENEDNAVQATVTSPTNQESDHGPMKLFSCPEEGCQKKFFNYRSVINHIILGRHVYMRERETLRDASINLYKQAMRASEFFSSFPELAAAIDETSQTSAPLNEGWALKDTSRTSIRFTENQLSFLKEKFNEGIRGKKADPHKVAAEMQTIKMPDGKMRFSVSEYLKWNQIASFFSRMTSSAKRGSASASSRNTDTIAGAIDAVLKRTDEEFQKAAQSIEGDIATEITEFSKEDQEYLLDPTEETQENLKASECFEKV